MNAANKRYMNEGVLRIAIFIMFASLTYTVRHYVWAIAALLVVGLYSLITGIIQLNRGEDPVEDNH